MSAPDTDLQNEITHCREIIRKFLAQVAFIPRQFSPSPRIHPTAQRRAQTPLASQIDHTLLKADARLSDVERVCSEARTHGFATVCLNSYWIRRAATLLAGSTVKPIAVVGFPLGASATAAKAFETRQAIQDGAREIDMVIALGALKDGDLETVLKDIAAVVDAAGPHPVKVILETTLLSTREKILACLLSQAAGAAFVKTSTGFAAGGATVQDVALMRSVVGDALGVKASGGIRTFEDAERMIQAGADRIGASSSVAIANRASNPPSAGQAY